MHPLTLIGIIIVAAVAAYYMPDPTDENDPWRPYL